jgi:uncharacterized protein YqeY
MSRLDRLKELQKSLKEYLANERKRLENEVSVLESILDGRTAGKGIQQVNTTTISSVAESDLAKYLKGS